MELLHAESNNILHALAAHLRIPYNPSRTNGSFAHLELRFDEQDGLTFLRKERHHARNHLFQRDEGKVASEEANRLRDKCIRQMTRVRLLEGDDAHVVPQSFVELPRTHIHRIDTLCPLFQKHLRETACRRP